MTASVKQLQANRQNALCSTGPRSTGGKSRVAGNALKHGILSQKLLLEHECAEDFQALMEALQSDLRPVGTLEHLLVERIALSIWRQRRLIRSETAVIQQEYQPHNFQTRVSRRLPSAIHYRFTADWMKPPDDDQLQYCRDLLAEIDGHDNPQVLLDDPGSLLSRDLAGTAAEEGQAVTEVLEDYNGLAGYLEVVRDYCWEATERAEWHPTVQAIAELVRAETSIPDHATRESLSRYQIALDNQLYRALKELRTAQAWREQCLEGEVDQAND